jgi:NADH:ubiquinone oxidoreductase subunit E
MMPTNSTQALIQEITQKLDAYGRVRSALPFILPLLQTLDVEETKPVLQFLSAQLNLPPVEISGLFSFYQNAATRRGTQIDIRLCHAYWFEKPKVKELAQALQHKFQIAFGTATPDGEISLNWSACPGYPNQAPVLLVNDVIYTHVKPQGPGWIMASCGNQIYFPNFSCPIPGRTDVFFGLKQGKALNAIMQNSPRPKQRWISA